MPNSSSTGDFACATQFQISSSFPNPETPEDRSTEALVILAGDGTGSLGFDENSVSREGERYLVLGTHLSCGDVVQVNLSGDVDPIGFSGLGVFSGRVEVVPR